MNGMGLFDPGIAQPLLAGWIIGAVVGLIDTAVVVIAVARAPRWPDQLSQFRVSLPALTIAAANGMVIGWTLIGLLIGAVSIVVPMPRFAIGVAAVTLGVLAMYVYVRGLAHRGEAQIIVGTGLIAGLGFAVVLPLLAAWRR